MINWEKNGCHEGLKTGYPYDHRKMNLNSLWTHCFHQGSVNYAASYSYWGGNSKSSHDSVEDPVGLQQVKLEQTFTKKDEKNGQKHGQMQKR